MKRLIVNADDFGLTRGVNRGIIRTFQDGILTSTTLMANAPAFDDAVALAKSNPRLGVGCHMVLVGGPAVGSREKIGRLADENGQLPASIASLVWKVSSGRVKSTEIAAELLAQFEKVRSAGISPTHFDSHKHTQCHPVVMDALITVAMQTGVKKLRRPYESAEDLWHGAGATAGDDGGLLQKAAGLAAMVTKSQFEDRVRKAGVLTPAHFYGIASTGKLSAAGIARLLENLPDGTSELMSHPGEPDAELRRIETRLCDQRKDELEALLSPNLRNILASAGVQLISYRELV